MKLLQYGKPGPMCPQCRTWAGHTKSHPGGEPVRPRSRTGPAGVTASVRILSAVSAVDGEVRTQAGWGADLHLVAAEFHLRRVGAVDVAGRDRQRRGGEGDLDG